MQTFTIKSVDAINEVAAQFLKAFNKPSVFCFYGSMGAGKTTFITALCEQLKVVDIVNSPTFSIVNEYDTESDEKVYHFDFYRIKEQEEALDMGCEDYFYSDAYCFIEWPEKIDSLLPPKRYDVKIEVNDDFTRQISVIEQA